MLRMPAATAVANFASSSALTPAFDTPEFAPHPKSQPQLTHGTFAPCR
jgi:hypothetical protein